MFTTACKNHDYRQFKVDPRSAPTLEWADLRAAYLNVTLGCSNSCRYCIYPHRHPRARLVDRATLLELAESLSRAGTPVSLSDASDPCQAHPEVIRLTTDVARIRLDYGLPVCIHTKGGLRSLPLFSLLKENPCSTFGTSLSFVDKEAARFFEPGAASPASIISALKIAYEAGIFTWLCIAPVIDQHEALSVVKETAAFISFLMVAPPANSPVALPAPVMSEAEFKYRLRDILEKQRGPYRRILPYHFSRENCGTAEPRTDDLLRFAGQVSLEAWN
jgi:DNA repair photolyase